MNRSDEDLLRAARRDAGAFAVLYDRHAPALARWLERRSNPDSAQELLAETFAQAWIARRRYRPARGPVRAWLFGIAQHLRACFLPSGDPVAGSQLGPVLGLADGPADYDIKPLSAADAHAWLCAHPSQRPGADGGERPAPPMDC